jgi:hypothetical protein
MHLSSPPYVPHVLPISDFLTIMANAHNNFFLTVTEKLNIQKPEKGDTISFLKD